LGADEAIVASQGARDIARKFSEGLDVRMISSSVFEAIIKRYRDQNRRHSSEVLNEVWKKTSISRTTLKARVDSAKAEIANGIDFVALNRWIDDAADLLKLMLEREREPGPITRAMYLCCALVAIGADFLGKNHSLEDSAVRGQFFRQGMVFGDSDPEASANYMNFAESVVTDYLDSSGSAAAQIRSGFEKGAETLPIQGFVDFFARPNAGSELFKAAIALEEACHTLNLKFPAGLESVEAKTIIGLVSDYAGLKRMDTLGTREDGDTKRGDPNVQKQGRLI